MNRKFTDLIQAPRAVAPKHAPRARFVPARMMAHPASSRARGQVAVRMPVRVLGLALAMLCVVAALAERGTGTTTWWLLAASAMIAIPLARPVRRDHTCANSSMDTRCP